MFNSKVCSCNVTDYIWLQMQNCKHKCVGGNMCNIVSDWLKGFVSMENSEKGTFSLLNVVEVII